MANSTPSSIKVDSLLLEEGKVILSATGWDFDNFDTLGLQIVTKLSARVLERQTDADIHSWLIDFEGCEFLLKAEHYSEAVWLEALNPKLSHAECQFIADWLSR